MYRETLESSGRILSCLFRPFSLQQFLLQLLLLLFVNVLLDLLFEPLLLAPDLFQLGFPLCLQVWILEGQQQLALARVSDRCILLFNEALLYPVRLDPVLPRGLQSNISPGFPLFCLVRTENPAGLQLDQSHTEFQ